MKTKEEIDKTAEHLINTEILAVQTSLVEECLSKEVFSWDDVQNPYSYPEYIGSYCSFLGGTQDDLDEVIEYITVKYKECDSDERVDDIYNELYDLEHLEEEPQEIFEWWLVTEWMKNMLIKIGEPVLSNDFGNWWGRTCTGQSISMDGTIQKIVKLIQ